MDAFIVLIIAFGCFALGFCLTSDHMEIQIKKGHAIYIGDDEYRCVIKK